MAKLYFRYSAMNAGKTLSLLSVAYNYKERNQNVIILTSSLDDRYGVGKVKSRTGLEMPAIAVKNDDNLLDIINFNEKIDCILIDEIHFFTETQIYSLLDITDNYNIPIICYGLRCDFKNKPFHSSSILLSICDSIEEIKTICHCGRKATVNARICDGKIIYDGPQIQIGGNESYQSLCRKHWKEGKIN